MHNIIVTKFELSELLTQNQGIGLNKLLKKAELTQYDFVQITCQEEFVKLRSKFGDKDTLTMRAAADALEISYPHLVRLKLNGQSIPYTQDGERAPVYFPIWAIAVHNYLKSHPIIPGRITFSNLLSEI